MLPPALIDLFTEERHLSRMESLRPRPHRPSRIVALASAVRRAFARAPALPGSPKAPAGHPRRA
jgi:hypothetical protein